jgi:5-formyltetrahydrofolate cyclo-ligase
LTRNDVVLLPGVAFDRNGWRLGRGGGHYDRAFPPGAESPWLVGVGYSFQWLAEVPHDSRDRRVDAIVTEHGWVWRARGTT